MTDTEFGYVHGLAEDYLKYVLQIQQPGSKPSKTSRVLQDVASSVQDEVERTLKQCLDKFDVVSVDTARTIFNQVMEKEFEDGIVNWGRIVTIFAFEGILSKKLLGKCIASDMDMCKDISYFVAEFITENTGEWIKQNGGWVCVMEVFFFVLYFKIGNEIASLFGNLKKRALKTLKSLKFIIDNLESIQVYNGTS